MFCWLRAGRQDTGTVDGARGDSVQEVHVGERRVVDGDRVLGGDVVRGAAVLELVQSGRHQEHRERIQVCFTMLG